MRPSPRTRPSRRPQPSPPGLGLPLTIETPSQGEGGAKSHGTPLLDESKQDARAATERSSVRPAVCHDGKTLTFDQGGTASTRDVARAVLAAHRSA